MPAQPLAATKGLYRRLDALVEALHAREQGPSFLAATLRALFDAFQSELGMRGAWLLGLAESPPATIAHRGEDAPDPAPALPPDLRARRVSLRDAPAAHGAPGAPSSPTGSPIAAFEITPGERAFAFVFRFRADWNRDAVELVLNTARSILQVKLDEERLGAVLREAAEIQASLLPPHAPDFPGYEIAARSVPAEEVGGDWFEFLPLGEASLGISIGDASGHGLAAALMARDVVVGLRMGIERELRIDYVLEKLNRVLHRSALSSCFASLLFGELEENGSFFYYSAGHDAPLLLDERGCELLRTGGPVLGPLPEVHLRRHFAHLDHGATLVLYTDGLIERGSRSGERFGIERLRATLVAARALPPEKLLEHVFATVEAFADGASNRDDETLVIVRRKG